MHYKVLVVDDSKLARMVMASALRRIRPDWELVEATNAADAMAAIPAQSVDIALVDFNMPETDGLELVANIRQAHPAMPVARGIREPAGRDYWPGEGTKCRFHR